MSFKKKEKKLLHGIEWLTNDTKTILADNNKWCTNKWAAEMD